MPMNRWTRRSGFSCGPHGLMMRISIHVGALLPSRWATPIRRLTLSTDYATYRRSHVTYYRRSNRDAADGWQPRLLSFHEIPRSTRRHAPPCQPSLIFFLVRLLSEPHQWNKATSLKHTAIFA